MYGLIYAWYHAISILANARTLDHYRLWEQPVFFSILGVNADEVHLCGEDTVIDIIRDMSLDTGDDVEVRR